MDKDLMILKDMTNEELGIIVDIMCKKWLVSKELKNLKETCGDYKGHEEIIANELCLSGGNTIVNIPRGKGVPYKEILTDVCDKLKVPFNKNRTIEHIEGNLLETVLEKPWENMTVGEKRKLIDDLGRKKFIVEIPILEVTIPSVVFIASKRAVHNARVIEE